MAVVPRETRDYPSLLGRPGVSLAGLNVDVLLFAGVLLLSIFAHLYGLGRMALHHDESIHAWMSWKFYTGAGGFVCWGGRVSNTYCYDPVYHGPSLYVLTLLSYFLFGDGDLQARLPQAVAGIALTASAWWLRPYLGNRGALLAAVLLAFTPSLLYYTRFARHDGLMVLWTLWIVIGFFRYLDTGRAAWLMLLAVGGALAIATHELYYILGFIFGWFLIIRVLYELLPRRTVTIFLASIASIALLVELSIFSGIWYGRLTPTLRADGIALLFLTVSGVGLLMSRVWHPAPVVVPRAVGLWREQRPQLWIALGLLAAIFVVLYSVFFTDVRGILDGLYAGLAYWLGSQQEFARGDQPWYYYLILMLLYEPLAFFGGIAATIFLLARPMYGRPIAPRPADAPQGDEDGVEGAETAGEPASGRAAGSDVPSLPDPQAAVALFPLFLAFWFLCALVAFSWAGEKMPWLNTHIALPGNLLLAWTLAQLVGVTRWRSLDRWAWVVPPALALLATALGVALWRFNLGGANQEAQASILQGLVPLAIAFALLYGLLTIGQRIGARPTLALCALTVAVALGIYTLRASWLVVYRHPDTPVEPLIYTQSTPDVPLIVAEIRELAINQTRTQRSATDPAGGLSMPVIMDNGDPDAGGEGSLAWPYQWYLRDFQRIEVRNASFFREASPDSFLVDAPDRAGEKIIAPVVLVSRQHVNETALEALEASYVKLYDTKLNWWFPEGNKCDPASPGYKRFYYAYPGSVEDALRACPAIEPASIPGFHAPLLWPLDSSHWNDTRRYLLYRELPPGIRIDGREMQVWVRSDLALRGDGPAAATSVASGPLKLVATQVIGEGAELSEPRGVAVAPDGSIIVSDTGNHRLVIFDAEGRLVRQVGEFGAGDGQFNEPRGVAVDAQGNIYVADTWNARVVKLDPQGTFLTSWGEGREDFGDGRRASPTDGTLEGNAASPLGFFGPRGVAVDSQGNVYVADTGNKRIVVTDSEGTYRSQWGAEGSNAGQFREPIGVSVDPQGNVYVADTWNGRVQLFAPDASGQIGPDPLTTWRVRGWEPQTYDDPFVAADGERVVVSVPGRSALLLTSTGGAEVLRWGGSGTDFASTNLPSGVAFAPDGTVLAVDRGNGRVLRFALPLVQPPGAPTDRQ